MCYLRLLYSVFVVIPSIVECSVGLKTFFFNDLCVFSRQSYIRTINLGSTLRDYNSSAILKAKKFGFYPTDVSCTVIIQPPPGYGVVAAVRSTDLRPSCVDNLTLTDSLTFNRTFCSRNSYSQEKLSMYSPSRLTAIFKTGSFFEGSTASYDGFQLTVTTYKNWPCSSDFEFECSNLRCISKELRCDRHNHCGDGSDQSRCGVKSVGGIIGVIFGCIFVAIAVVAGTVYYRTKGKNRIVTTTAYLNPQPPQPTYPHPAYGTTYPPQGTYYPPLQGPYATPSQAPYPLPARELYRPPPEASISPPPPQRPTAPPSQYSASSQLLETTDPLYK